MVTFGFFRLTIEALFGAASTHWHGQWQSLSAGVVLHKACGAQSTPSTGLPPLLVLVNRRQHEFVLVNAAAGAGARAIHLPLSYLRATTWYLAASHLGSCELQV